MALGPGLFPCTLALQPLWPVVVHSLGTGFGPQAVFGGSLDATSRGLEYRTQFPLHVKKECQRVGLLVNSLVATFSLSL